MRNIKLIIEYDGVNYHGWQSQENAVTIQETIENAVFSCTNEECKIIGAGRTDVGVHAYGQAANFLTNSSIPEDKFTYALNRILPDDIVIKDSREVPLDFHARFDAKGKKYRYLIYNSRYPSALLRNRAYHVIKELDTDLMEAAAKYIIGTHDFQAFCASGSSVKSFERTVNGITVNRNGELIEIEVWGTGFLYNMVRIIAGTLIEVGLKRFSPSYINEIILSKDRRKAGRTAPACGLYMVEVYY